MDIFDDLLAVLRVVLDYCGVDLQDVQDILEEINARRRVRFYQTRQLISTNWNRVVFRRRCLLESVNKFKSDVRHRSLIRILGTYLPLRTVKRVKIQNNLLQSRQHKKYIYDSDSDDSVITTTSIGSTTDDDIIWVEEEFGDNCVRIRAEKRRNFEDCDDIDEIDEGLFIARPSLSPMSSTMISSVSSVFQNPAEQTQKITAMEEELLNLRQQIAMLVEAQEQTNKSQIPQQSFKEEEEPVVTSKPPPCPVAPPLPPPPPPLPTQSVAKQSVLSFSPIESEQKKTVLQPINANKTNKTPNTQPTLTDVLKGLGNVKLRSIQRSPGGTPVKPKPKRRDSTTSDPASVIAQALKKKFANQILHSPDVVDKENDSYGFSSPDTDSPHCIGLGGRRIRKRSIFADDKRLSGSIRI